MIVYLSTEAHKSAIENFLEGEWGVSARRRIRHVGWESLAPAMEAPVATYLFTDFERLSASQMCIARQLWKQLQAQGLRTLNDPHEFVPRFELLRRLHDQGLNDYNVYRPGEIDQVRYPAFVRVENDHDGPRSPLLHSREEVEKVLFQGLAFGIRPEHLMIIEFCDCLAEDGFYRKYAYWNFEGRLVPNHAIIDRSWITKGPTKASGDRWTCEQVQEEAEFMRTAPHQDEVRAAFEAAGLRYGRVDYGVRDGRVQIWEVNSHPVPNHGPVHSLPERLPSHKWFADEWEKGIESIDTPDEPRRTVTVRLDVMKAMQAR